MPERSAGRTAAVRDAIEAMAGWQVLVAQFNDLVARRLGVSPTETQCLYVLARFGPATPGELARRVNLSSGATTRMLDRLLAAGYITRSPDPHDRRRVVIAPAGDGIARVAAMYEPLNADLAGLLTDFGGADLQRLARFARAAEEVTEGRIREL
ncbi:MarR family transcriptional regulator [Mycobacterium sp. NPDC050551]|uniref:MarR family winged helix-turn-helix transcriptional regulator n=1 Tax=Mycobacterium sp. NPDC050551 TaxID=3155407 RepID=UPI003428C9EA